MVVAFAAVVFDDAKVLVVVVVAALICDADAIGGVPAPVVVVVVGTLLGDARRGAPDARTAAANLLLVNLVAVPFAREAGSSPRVAEH